MLQGRHSTLAPVVKGLSGSNQARGAFIAKFNLFGSTEIRRTALEIIFASMLVKDLAQEKKEVNSDSLHYHSFHIDQIQFTLLEKWKPFILPRPIKTVRFSSESQNPIAREAFDTKRTTPSDFAFRWSEHGSNSQDGSNSEDGSNSAADGQDWLFKCCRRQDWWGDCSNAAADKTDEVRQPLLNKKKWNGSAFLLPRNLLRSQYLTIWSAPVCDFIWHIY